MAGTKPVPKKDVRAPSSAARSSGADQDSSNVSDSGSQQQGTRGSKGLGSGPAAPDSVQAPSMRNKSSKGPSATAIIERHGVSVTRDTELMLLASEITELKVIHKHMLSPKPMGQKLLDAKLQEATGLALQVARLYALRMRISEALGGSAGTKRVVLLRALLVELQKLAEEATQRDFKSITAYALMAVCLLESVKEGESRVKAAHALGEAIEHLRSKLGLERNGGTFDASVWLDPKLETVIESGSKGSLKQLDKIEGVDMLARLKSRHSMIMDIHKLMDASEDSVQSENRKQDAHDIKRVSWGNQCRVQCATCE